MTNHHDPRLYDSSSSSESESESESQEPEDGASSEPSSSSESFDNLTPAERVQRVAADAVNAISKFWQVCYEEQTAVLDKTIDRLNEERNKVMTLEKSVSLVGRQTRDEARKQSAEVDAAAFVAKTARDELAAVQAKLKEKTELADRQRSRIGDLERAAKAGPGHTHRYALERLEILEAFMKEQGIKLPDSHEPTYPGNQLKDLRARVENQDEAIKELNERLNAEREDGKKHKLRNVELTNEVTELKTRLSAATVEAQRYKSDLAIARSAGDTLRQRVEELQGQAAVELEKANQQAGRTHDLLEESKTEIQGLRTRAKDLVAKNEHYLSVMRAATTRLDQFLDARRNPKDANTRNSEVTVNFAITVIEEAHGMLTSAGPR